MTIRAMTYYRVSGVGQDVEHDGTSLETQEQACRALVAERGYELVASYSDVHSGYELRERPGMTKLRAAMRNHEVDVVVALAMDRLSREQNQQGAIFYEAEDAGVRLEFVTEDFENSATGKFMRSAKSFVAEVEREKIRERTTRGKRALLETGRIIRGFKPRYGYRFSQDGRRFEEDAETAAVVRRIFGDYLSGLSLRAIAKHLSEERIPTPMGRTDWYPTSVRHVLTEGTYTGVAFGFRSVMGVGGGKKKRVTVPRPRDEWIALPEGTAPALIEPAVFARAQDRLGQNQALASRNNQTPEAWLLRGGLVRCAHCGHVLLARREGKGGWLSYRCWKNSNIPAGETRCPSPAGMPAGELDAIAWEFLVSTLTDPARIAAEFEAWVGADRVEEDAAPLIARLAKLRQQQDVAVKNLLTIQLSPEMGARVSADLARLEADATQLEAEIDAIRRRAATLDEQTALLTGVQAWCAQAVAVLTEDLSYDRKREIMRQVELTAEVHRGKDQWEVRLRLPKLGADEFVYSEPSYRVHNDTLLIRRRSPALEAALAA